MPVRSQCTATKFNFQLNCHHHSLWRKALFDDESMSSCHRPSMLACWWHTERRRSCWKKISVNLAVKNVPHNFIHMTTLRVRRKCPSFPSIEPGDGLRDKSDIVRIKAFACSIENIVDGQISTLPLQSMPLSEGRRQKRGQPLRSVVESLTPYQSSPILILQNVPPRFPFFPAQSVRQ